MIQSNIYIVNHVYDFYRYCIDFVKFVFMITPIIVNLYNESQARGKQAMEANNEAKCSTAQIAEKP